MNVNKVKSNCSISILLYHQVNKAPKKHTNLDCFCTTKQFNEQMKFLKDSEYQIVTLEQAIEIANDKKENSGKYIVLTFDDGCDSFYEYVYPILHHYGFSSIIYPVAGYLGKGATWGGNKKRGFKILSKSRLIELNQLGNEIGAHTMDHVKLAQVRPDEAELQIKRSKDYLEQLLGKSINSFAYPHGEYNSGIIRMVQEAGFKNAVTCIPNKVEKATLPFELPRLYITHFDALESFKQKLN